MKKQLVLVLKLIFYSLSNKLNRFIKSVTIKININIWLT
jgi:hypothetical protein